MKRRNIKLWTGLGAYLMASASTAALTADAAAIRSSAEEAKPVHAAGALFADAGHGGEAGERGHGGEGGEHAQGGEGGEGGQGGEGGEGGERGAFGGLSDHAELAARLLTMKGHLRAGKDLFAAGNEENAAMHFAHPLSEEYEHVGPLLREHDIPQFRDTLSALTDSVVEARDREATLAALEEAEAALDGALKATLNESGSDATLTEALTALLRKAAHEYAESVEEGRITVKEEYQDARGFVLVAQATAENASETLRKRDAEEYSELVKHLDTLAGILETPVPPADAKASPSEVYGTVARAEFALRKLR